MNSNGNGTIKKKRQTKYLYNRSSVAENHYIAVRKNKVANVLFISQRNPMPEATKKSIKNK